MKMSYKPGHSWFHRMDALTKFAWCCLISVWLLSIRDLVSVVAVSLGVIVVALRGANMSLRKYLKTMMLFIGAGIYLVLFQGLFRPGPGIDIGPLHFSYTGMELGLVLALRTFGIVASSLAFSRTTSPKDLSLGLVKIGLPYQLAHIAYMSLRFLPVLEIDLRTINDAQKLRGIKPGFKKLSKTLIAMMATQIRRAEQTAIALETRGFGLHSHQTPVEVAHLKPDGKRLLALTVGLVVLHVLVLVLT